MQILTETAGSTLSSQALRTDKKSAIIPWDKDLSGFHHHKRLTTMVRRDGDLGGRQEGLPRMSEKLFPLLEKGAIAIFGKRTTLKN
jgi:hypothetical protein